MKVGGFEGKNVYVVGGSSGIGRAAAELLAGRGANVIIFARGRERLEETLAAMETRRQNGDQSLSLRQVDITDHDRVESVMAAACEEFGPPDILINSAGRALPDYFENISYQQLDDSMKLHLYGNWNTIEALLPHLNRRHGYIVNVASVLGFMGLFGYSDYCASKFALIGLSEALRSELKPSGVGISVVCPPDTDTPGFAVENIGKPPETKAASEGGGLMQPEEVAEALLKGIEKGKFLIAPGSAKMIYIVNRHIPALVNLFTDLKVKKAHQGGQPPASA
jgi:3-dehydrosphinganine reductase